VRVSGTEVFLWCPSGFSVLGLAQLKALLHRFAEHDLDQFENLRFDTRYGPVFIAMTRELPPGWPPAAFTSVPVPAAYGTGRAAHVSGAADAASREELLAVIATMREDFAATGAGEWENADLGRFLDGLAGFLADLDGYFARRGQQVPDQPSWGLLAATLIAATGYE
jgi:hypothetical protein